MQARYDTHLSAAFSDMDLRIALRKQFVCKASRPIFLRGLLLYGERQELEGAGGTGIVLYYTVRYKAI